MKLWGGGGVLESPCPSGHASRNLVRSITPKATNFKFHTQIGHIVEKCSVQEP